MYIHRLKVGWGGKDNGMEKRSNFEGNSLLNEEDYDKILFRSTKEPQQIDILAIVVNFGMMWGRNVGW